jgi:hypothetical protein
MPLLTGPLLSLGAKGKFLQELVFQGTIRGPTLRRLGRKRPPPTPAQIAQQQIVAGSILSWHTIAGDQRFQSQWSRLLQTIRGQHSNYSEYERSAITLATQSGGTGFVKSIRASWNGALYCEAIDVITAGAPTDTAFSQLWYGDTPSTMTIKENHQVTGGTFTLNYELLPGETKWFKFTRAGIPASGLVQITYQGPKTNLVHNGGFTDQTYWQLGQACQITANMLQFHATASGGSSVVQTLTGFTPGKYYDFELLALENTGYAPCAMYAGGYPVMSWSTPGLKTANAQVGSVQSFDILMGSDPGTRIHFTNITMTDPDEAPP